MAHFPTSSHRARWLFDPAALEEARQATREAACRAIESAYEEARRCNVETTHEGPPELLTADEEAVLIDYYSHKAAETCRAFSLPDGVTVTASAYVRRFFLRQSILDHSPKGIALACVYLACKAEERYVGAEEFAKTIGQDPGEVLALEPQVLNGLNFDLILHSPFWALRGWLDALWRCLGASAPDDAAREALAAKARKEALALWLTDAMFLALPSVIGLLALRRAAAGASTSAVVAAVASDAHLMSDGGRVAGASSAASPASARMAPAEVRAAVDALDAAFPRGCRGSVPPATDAAAAADRRLRQCRNPATDPSTQLYAHLHAQLAEEREERRRAKLHKKRLKQEAEDAALTGVGSVAGLAS